METIKNIIIIGLLFIAICGFVVYGLYFWHNHSQIIAEGNKLRWFGYSIFGGFCIWQIEGIYSLYKMPEKRKAKKFITRCLYVTCALVAIYILFTNYMVHSGNPDYQFYKEHPELSFTILPDEISILSILDIIIKSLFSIIGTGIFLFCTILLGRIGIGASVAIGIHNWINGAGFDIGLIIESLFNLIADINLNDITSTIITIIWFIFTVILYQGDS